MNENSRLSLFDLSTEQIKMWISPSAVEINEFQCSAQLPTMHWLVWRRVLILKKKRKKKGNGVFIRPSRKNQIGFMTDIVCFIFVLCQNTALFRYNNSR